MLDLARRPRRLRKSSVLRAMVRENRVHPSQLVLPIFLVEGAGKRESIDWMPGVERLSIDLALHLIEDAMAYGVRSFAIFPRIEKEYKSHDGSSALREDSLVCRALRAFSKQFPEAELIADIALDPYSVDGHDGIVNAGVVLNDETVQILSQMAVLHAQAGASVVAPSDMMDGRVGAIRSSLESAGLHETVIMSYAAKYASAFYGPFRQALGSAPALKLDVPTDKATYQMDPANAREALREAALDIEEGADILLVKPGLPYLDVLYQISVTCGAPVAAYHVSGEYAMLRMAAERGILEYDTALAECLSCFIRSGAQFILTYGALDAARFYYKEAGFVSSITT